jgi:predicted lipoprotein with Yx(FWY)xxD motif
MSMRRTGWTIGSAVVFFVVCSVGVALSQYNYGSPTPPQPAPPSNQSNGPATGYAVNVAVATVQGKQEQVLTDAKGMTLYYFTADTPSKSACTGDCAKMWTPLLSKAVPTHPAALSGKFSIVNDDNGRQVSYNGHLLYTYSGDSSAGQAAGDGLYGKWYVAKPALAAASSSAPRTTSGGSGTGW